MIIEAIRSGVQIFDLGKLTSLRPDWSKQGLGLFNLLTIRWIYKRRVPDKKKQNEVNHLKKLVNKMHLSIMKKS